MTYYRSFVSDIPFAHYLEGLNDVPYWQTKKKDLMALYDKYPKIDRLGQFIAERGCLMFTHRLDRFSSETREERFQILQRKNSRLFQEIPQYIITFYSGLIAETLGKIRKRLANK